MLKMNLGKRDVVQKCLLIVFIAGLFFTTVLLSNETGRELEVQDESKKQMIIERINEMHFLSL